MKLQEIVDRGGSDIKLTPGEYEGPLVINKPCVLHGAGCTIWCRQGPVVTIESPNVVVEGLRIEVTGTKGSDLALVCRARNITLNNVEVYGRVQGLGEEDGGRIPRTIDLGFFAPDTKNEFIREIDLPAPAEVSAQMTGVHVLPATLPAGKALIRITTDALSADTCVWGEIFFQSGLKRRLYLRGCAKTGAPAVHETQNQSAGQTQGAAAPGQARRKPAGGKKAAGTSGRTQKAVRGTVPPKPVPKPSKGGVSLKKGERLVLAGDEIEVSMTGFASARHVPDCYVFLLNDSSRVRSDEDLVFFGQKQSADGAVQLMEGPQGPGAVVRIDCIPEGIRRVVVVFSAYDKHVPRSFWQGGRVEVREGSNVFTYPVDADERTRTITALHLYRHGNEWKLWLTDHRTHNEIADVCRSYGIEVE